MKIGNAIYYFTKYTGIKFIVELYHKIAGTKCNCNKRRKKFNEIRDKKENRNKDNEGSISIKVIQM